MKKMHVIIILAIFSMVTFQPVMAQDTTNYYVVKAKLQQNFDSTQIANPDTSNEKDCPFSKWQNYWDVRLRPSGSFVTWRQGFEAYIADFLNNQPVSTTILPLQWTQLGPLTMPEGQSNDMRSRGLGQIHYIAIDPNNNNNMLACSPVGGLFRSIDHGLHWVNAGTDKALPRCGVSSVTYDRNNSETNWFISTGNGEAMPGGMVWQNATGIWRTLDAGETWTRIDNVDIWQMRKIISVPSSNNVHLFVASTNGLYECTNALDANPIWTQVNSNYFYDVEQDQHPNSTIVYAASTESNSANPAGVFSYDWVTHAWTKIIDAHSLNGVPAYDQGHLLRTTIHISPAAPDYIFLGIAQDHTMWSHLFRYNLLTQTTIDKGSFPATGAAQSGLLTGRALGWAISPVLRSDGDLTISEGNVNPIYQTNNVLLDNNACIWTDVGGSHVHDDTHFMVFESDGQTLWVGCDGGVYESHMPDLINHWQERCNGLAISEVQNVSVSNITDQKLAGLYDDGSLLYKKNGSSWLTKHVLGGDGHACLISPFNSKTMYVTAEPSNLAGSFDGGETWTLWANLANSELAYFIMNSADENKLYCTSVQKATIQGGIWHSIDKGYNWSPWYQFPGITVNGVNDASTWRVETSPTNSNYLYASWIGPRTDPPYYQKIFKSVSGGGTSSGDWLSVGSPSDYSWISSIAVDYNNPDHIWVSASAQNIAGKVYDVNTTTSQWTDITVSKPLQQYIDVECLQHLKGSNGGLFAATGYGLYYTDNNLAQWENISGNIPNTEITDIKINYTKGTIVAGAFGRGMWEADLPCTDNQQPITVTFNQTWSDYRRILHDITIEPGANLTVTGEISLGTGVRIIVKKGAILTIDGGKLTNACHGLWSWVEVWGDNSKSQYPDPYTGQMYQGQMIIKNGGTIENSDYAVRLWKPGDYSTGGGIVMAKDALFKNNRHAAEFITFHNSHPISGAPMNNLSYFIHCTFRIDDSYYWSDPFYAFITMWQVEGIQIKGSIFSNTKSYTTSIGRGYGIYTIDAGYIIDVYCNSSSTPCPSSSVIRSSFQGLFAGISALNESSPNTVYINKTDFKDNSYGIRLNAVNNATTVLNTIDIGSNSICPNFTGIGVELNNCTGYTIEQNSFTHTGSSNPGDKYLGIRVIGQTNPAFVTYNRIYNNSASGITVGNQAEKNNYDQYNTGLYYICNENNNNIYDFYVFGDGGDGIAQYQGSYSQPAGNRFSKNANNPYSDFNNQAAWTITYKYYDGDPLQLPESVYNIINQGTPIQNLCPNNYGSNGIGIEKLSTEQISALQSEYADNITAYNNIKGIYESLKDGGSTSTLSSDINNSTPDQTMKLRDELLGSSPHLSREILVAAANKNDVLPDPILFEILAANPDELRNDSLLNYLKNKTNPLPNYMIELLKAVAIDSTYKTTLQAGLSYYYAKSMNAVYALTRDILLDSVKDYTNLRNWLDNQHTISADYQIIDSWFAEKNTTSALALLDLLPQTYSLDSSAMIEYNYYKDLKTFQAGLITNKNNIFQLDSTQIAFLDYTASNSKGIAGDEARNILEFAYGAFNINCPPSPDYPVKSTSFNAAKNLNSIYEPKITVAPNPAGSWTVFNYTLLAGVNNSWIQITDMKNQVIKILPITKVEGQITWDTRDLPAGLYLFTLINDKYSKSGKVSVVH
ncbi:MAG: T9SS type A sorting domain-containing protein [Bacteroidota bacterium]